MKKIVLALGLLFSITSFANDGQKTSSTIIEQIKSKLGSNYKVVVKKIYEGNECTEYHIVFHRGRAVAEFTSEESGNCGITIHWL